MYDFTSREYFPLVGTEEHRDIRRIFQHEDYNSQTIENDVCLLHLSSPFNFTEVVSAVTLPEPMQETPEGTMIQVSGFGVRSEFGLFPSESLQKVDLPIVGDEACGEAYDGINPVAESMICAGFDEGGKDSCSGDSGGPLCLKDGNRVGFRCGLIK